MKNMTIGNPAKLLAGFAIPILIGSLFQQIYSFVDVIIVGRFLGEEALAAVGSTNNLTFFLLSHIFGLSNGAGVIVSQYYGAGRFDNMKRVITAIIWISAAVSLVISFIGVTFVTLFLRVSVPENIIDYAADYLCILYLCSRMRFDQSGCEVDKTLTREEADSIAEIVKSELLCR